MKRNHRTTSPKIAAELNDHFENSVSTKTIRRELHKAGFHERAAIRKPLLSKSNVAKHLEFGVKSFKIGHRSNRRMSFSLMNRSLPYFLPPNVSRQPKDATQVVFL